MMRTTMLNKMMMETATTMMMKTTIMEVMVEVMVKVVVEVAGLVDNLGQAGWG